jgi:hypothetical protein
MQKLGLWEFLFENVFYRLLGQPGVIYGWSLGI